MAEQEVALFQPGGLMYKVIVGVAVVVLSVASWWWSSPDPVGGAVPAAKSGEVTALVQTAERQPYADEFEALGTTRAAESVEITARVSSIITEIHFEEGKHYEKGAPLVALENSEARADYAEAQAALVESRGRYTRSRELLRTKAVSESEVEQLEAQMSASEAALAAAAARVQNHLVRAPFAGRVGLRRISVGTLVTPGTVVTTLDDVSSVLVDFEVPETYLAGVAAGQTLVAHSAAYPEREFEGVVETIDSRLDPVTRAVTVRARMPNDDDLLRPGMFLTIRALRELTQLLMVAEQAIVPRRQRQYLFIVEDGIARELEVETGRRAPGRVEITRGLQPGALVVVEGTLHIRDGQPVDTSPWRAPGAGS